MKKIEPMFEQFSEQGRQIIKIAKEEAVRHGDDYLGTQHFLLAILQLGQDGPVNVFQKVGLNIDQIRQAAAKHLLLLPKNEFTGKVSKRIPFSPKAKEAFAHATEESHLARHDNVDARHLSLGILRTRDATAQMLLTYLGITLELARDEITKVAKSGK